jgi:hypothetical protein
MDTLCLLEEAIERNMAPPQVRQTTKLVLMITAKLRRHYRVKLILKTKEYGFCFTLLVSKDTGVFRCNAPVRFIVLGAPKI